MSNTKDTPMDYKQFEGQITSQDWIKWSEGKNKPSNSLRGPYLGCWLDGEMTGYARCMVNEVFMLQKKIFVLEEQIKTMQKS